MPLRNFNPKLTKEAREAVSEAFDAVAEWHTEMAAGSNNVFKKMAIAARALGWPDYVVNAIIAQVQGITQVQIQLTSHILDAWQEQIKSPNPMAHFPTAMMSKLQSWPGLSSTFEWPTLEVFGDLSRNPAQFWMQMGEQWQKSWAQAMPAWAELALSKK